MIVIILGKREGNAYCKYQLDVKIEYPDGKWETFRGIKYIEKDKSKFVNFPSTKIGEEWFPIYERSTPFNNIKKAIIDAVIASEKEQPKVESEEYVPF